MWNIHETAKECFEHPEFGKGFGYKLKKQKEDYFKNNNWVSPFYNFAEQDKHKVSLKRAPKPLEIIKLNESYGEEVLEAKRVAYRDRHRIIKPKEEAYGRGGGRLEQLELERVKRRFRRIGIRDSSSHRSRRVWRGAPGQAG